HGKNFLYYGEKRLREGQHLPDAAAEKRAEFKENHTVHHTACTERGGAGKRVLFCRRRTVPGIAGRRETDRIQSLDRKSTRLNSSHVSISYAVFCLKKK